MLNLTWPFDARTLSLLAIAVSIAIQGLGQQFSTSPNVVYTNTFTIEQGLSQNNVACITKDRDGFIWVGTGNGLNRFDGYSFVQFGHSDKDSASISNDVIRELLLDSKGRMWIGTYDGLNLYDSETETFRNFLKSPTDDNSISQNTIQCLIEDRNRQLWVGTYWGLNKIDLETFGVTRYYHHEDGTGLPDNAVNALLEDRHGKIWVCTAKGISIVGTNGIEKTIPQSNAPDGLAPELIVGIAQDSTGAIYLGTNGSGVLRLENENDVTFEHFTRSSNDHSLGSNIIAPIVIDRKGVILVGTDGAGLYRYDGDGKFNQILGYENRALNSGSVHEIFVDEFNNYWLGHYGAGMTFIPGERPRFEHYQFFDSTMKSTGKNSVLAIVEDRDKKIWIGTDGAGLYKFDPVTKRFTSHLHSPGNKNSLSTNVVKSLLVDDKNNLYIGTYAGGLNHLDTRTMSYSHYMHDPDDTTSISTNHVWSLLQDRNKRIFVGQLGGLNEFLPTSQTFQTLTIPGADLITTQTASVFGMQEDRNGNIWMGTRLAGIHRYDPRTKSFKSFLNIPGDSLSFPTNEILELALDWNGKLLVGTDDNGLIRFDPDSFTFEEVVPHFQEENIPSILEDDAHNLWFTSFDGLHRYDPPTGIIYNYTITDGLQGAQFNEGARLKSSTGEYYFGGTNGLNVFRSEKIREDRSRPKVVFTTLSLFHDIVRINDESGLLDKSVAKMETITLQPDQNVFSIGFACLEYKFPKKNRYRYYLEGFDHDWNDANESRTATYTNLPPGSYTLKVSASNADGYWNEEAASIQIIVIPKWHQRMDVRIGLAVLLIVFTFSFIHVRTRFLFKQKRKLEQLVDLRTQLVETQKKEINDKNKKLEQAYEEVNTVNEELQNVNMNLEKLVEKRTEELKVTIEKLIETDKGLNTFLYRSSHDLRGPMTSLLGLAHLASMQNNQDELHPYFSSIEQTATGMLRLLRRLSDTGALFRSKRKTEIIVVDEFIQSVKCQLDELNTNDAVRIEFENKVGKSFTGDPILLSHIVVNLMENGIVFRGANDPYVKCVLRIDNQQLIIAVTNNGTGISAAVKERIFDMFYRGSERSIGNGLGLFIVKKSLEILEGSIEVNSEPNVLTIVTVKIPPAYADSHMI